MLKRKLLLTLLLMTVLASGCVLPPLNIGTTDPEPIKLEKADYLVHEWGVISGCEEEWLISSRPERTNYAIDKLPVLYIHAGNLTEFSLKVSFPDGHPTETYPKAVVSGNTIEWNNVRIESRSELSEEKALVSLDSLMPILNSVDADQLNYNGKKSNFLYYEGEGKFEEKTTIEFIPGGKKAIVSNNFPHPIYNVGVAVSRSTEIEPTQLMVAWVSEIEPWGEEVVELKEANSYPELKTKMEALGFTDKESEAFESIWTETFFAPKENGSFLRVFYLLPRFAVEKIARLEFEPEPKKVLRAIWVVKEVEQDLTEIYSVSEALERKEELNGRKIVLEGKSMPPINLACTEMNCSNEEPCCNTCTGSLALWDTKETTPAKIIFSSGKYSAKLTGCNGTDCGISCWPLENGKNYSVTGTWKSTEYGEKAYYLEAESFIENSDIGPLNLECVNDLSCDWTATNCCPETAGADWQCISPDNSSIECSGKEQCPEVLSPKPVNKCLCIADKCTEIPSAPITVWPICGTQTSIRNFLFNWTPSTTKEHKIKLERSSIPGIIEFEETQTEIGEFNHSKSLGDGIYNWSVVSDRNEWSKQCALTIRRESVECSEILEELQECWNFKSGETVTQTTTFCGEILTLENNCSESELSTLLAGNERFALQRYEKCNRMYYYYNKSQNLEPIQEYYNKVVIECY